MLQQSRLWFGSFTFPAAACLCWCLMGSIVFAQEANETQRREPPKLLRGGIVQQLRALSEEAVESLKPKSLKSQDGSAANSGNQNRYTSGGRNRPTADRNRGYRSAASRYQQETAQQAPSVPQRQPAPTPAANAEMPEMGSPNEENSKNAVKQFENSSLAEDGLPEIVTPEEALARLGGNATQAANGSTRQAAGQRRLPAPVISSDALSGNQGDTVHVTPKLPAAVRDSLRSGGYGAKSRYSTSTNELDAKDEPEPESTRLFPSAKSVNPTPNAPPKVSRVPLPGSARTKVASSKVSSSTKATSELAQKPVPAQNRQLNSSGQKAVSSPRLPTRNSSQPPQAPRVARTTPSLPRSETSKQQASSQNTAANRLKVPTRSPSATAQNVTAEPKPTWPALPKSTPSSVQVPTKLVGTPKSEQVNRYSPAAPKASQQTFPQLATPRQTTSSVTRNSLVTSQKMQPDATAAAPGVNVPRSPLKNSSLRQQAGSGAGITRNPTLPVPSIMRSANQRLKMETPHIVVVMNGPADLPVGAKQEYQIVVHNSDNIPLRGLILQMDVPAGVDTTALKPSRGGIEAEKAANGATLLTWTFEELGAGELAIVPLELTATRSQNFAITMEWTLVPLDGSTEVQVRSAQLEMALEGPAEVRFGEANTYRLRIRNPGDADARDVAVQLSAGPYGSSASNVGTIAAGSEESIDVELTFNQRGVIGISADATAAGGLSAKTEIDVLVKKASLVASLASPQLIYHGNFVPVEVMLQNEGDAATGPVNASVELPQGSELASAPPGASLQGQLMSWPVASIAAGETRSYDIQVKLLSEGQNNFNLKCTGPNGLSVAAQAQTNVQAIADLKLTVDDPIAPAPVGSEVPYELTLTNRGSKAAHNVTVIAQFSEGIEPKRCEGVQAKIVPGQAIFDTIPSIAAGETVKLRVLAVAASGGMHRFRAEVRNADSEVRLVQEESTQYLGSVDKPITRTATIPDGGKLR